LTRYFQLIYATTIHTNYCQLGVNVISINYEVFKLCYTERFAQTWRSVIPPQFFIASPWTPVFGTNGEVGISSM